MDLTIMEMMNNGFRPLPEEWWHFTPENEPYPDTCFDFPVDIPENYGTCK